jgi:hypothetical protein
MIFKVQIIFTQQYNLSGKLVQEVMLQICIHDASIWNLCLDTYYTNVSFSWFPRNRPDEYRDSIGIPRNRSRQLPSTFLSISY